MKGGGLVTDIFSIDDLLLVSHACIQNFRTIASLFLVEKAMKKERPMKKVFRKRQFSDLHSCHLIQM